MCVAELLCRYFVYSCVWVCGWRVAKLLVLGVCIAGFLLGNMGFVVFCFPEFLLWGFICIRVYIRLFVCFWGYIGVVFGG